MSLESMKILLVDDELGILDSLGILFKGEGYAVVAAKGGAEALDILS